MVLLCATGKRSILAKLGQPPTGGYKPTSLGARQVLQQAVRPGTPHTNKQHGIDCMKLIVQRMHLPSLYRDADRAFPSDT